MIALIKHGNDISSAEGNTSNTTQNKIICVSILDMY